MAFCPACNQEGGEGPLCVNCGVRLLPSLTCSRCGAGVGPAQRHCTNCGLNLESGPKAAAVEALPADAQCLKAGSSPGTPSSQEAGTATWKGIQIGDTIGSLLESVPRGAHPDVPPAQTPGIRIGDNKSETHIEQHINVTQAPPAAGVHDFCPVCGDYPERRDSFRCLKCGRGPICKRHRDPAVGYCPDCARPLVEERRRGEALRQDDEAFAAAQAKGGMAALEEYRRRFPTGRHLPRLLPPRDPAAGDVWISPADGREMAWIPPGDFTMGSPECEPGDGDEARHALRIGRGFWMDCTEVTNDAYRKFILANPPWQKGSADGRYHDGYYLRDWNGTDYPSGKGDHPVVFTSWYAARAYAEWLGKRLPTEAEWEYACRAGTVTAFWWGDRFDASRANNNRRSTVPAGDERRRNAWGLHDMAGNVWEWTDSLYRPYPFRAGEEGEIALPSGPRVCRGGAWSADPKDLRSASRSGRAPKGCSLIVGFRCAC